LGIVELEDRLVLSSASPGLGSALTSAAQISLPSDGSAATSTGYIGQVGGSNVFQIQAQTDGLLRASVHAGTMITSLSLLDAQGALVMRSDGQSPINPDDLIEVHLASGAYFLEVESSGGSGNFSMTTSFTSTFPPFQTVGDQSFYNNPIAVGDFNGDGIPDIATPNAVYLGAGDGTFRDAPGAYAEFSDALAMVSGDFNRDGKNDLAVVNLSSNDVSVFSGNGDGTFGDPQEVPAGEGPDALVSGDFNGDGLHDLAVADYASGKVSILLGQAGGSFTLSQQVDVGAGPSALACGYFNGDGALDLAVANYAAGTVSILLGNGNGTFQEQTQLAAGMGPISLVTGDFDGNGRTDLAVADQNSNDISVFLSRGDGTFLAPERLVAGDGPTSLVCGDFTGNGHLDLAVANSNSNDLSVFLGNGNGTFAAQTRFAAGNGPISLASGDFNRDGRLDLAVANVNTGDISVLFGKGDGTFYGQAPDLAVVGPYGKAAVSGDFNGDGRLDLAVADGGADEVSVFLGNGDGTFQEPKQFAVGLVPTSLVCGDFNGDGRLDLAAADSRSGEVSVLLGNGDGTFQAQQTYETGGNPLALVAGDFNGDGVLDLAVADVRSNDVTILLGNGDGTFREGEQFAVGDFPTSLVTGDFNGDGALDLAVTNRGSNDVSVLLGHGDGTFQVQHRFPVGDMPDSLVAGDFDGDGRLDLAVQSNGSTNISLLRGNGDGTFQDAEQIPAGDYVKSLIAGDFNGDGRLDLAAASLYSNAVSVLLGNGNGTFEQPDEIGVDAFPESMVSGDFDGNGRIDLAMATPDPSMVSVLMGEGNGTFVTSSLIATAAHTTPLVADVNGDGSADALVVSAAGDILYRQGRPGEPGSYNSPIIVNPGFPSRDIAFVPETDQGSILASVDARDDAVSLYAWRDGAFIRIGSLPTGQLPSQIVSADLSSDGWDDLIVTNADDGTLSVFLNNQMGSFWTTFNPFRSPVTLAVGVGISDVAAVDTTGGGRLDLVVTSKLTGQVSILANRGNGTFSPPAVYRGGTGIVSVDESSDLAAVQSVDATGGVAAGPIATGGPTALVTINPGSNTIGVLAGLGGGRFANPVTVPTTSPARMIRMADFNHDGITDLAVLTAVGLDVYLGNGSGGFLPPVSYDAGLDPDGLTIDDLNSDGKPDLLIGNPYGDLLVLLGQGDGSFQPPHKIDQAIALAAADLTGTGSYDFIYADQGKDRVVVAYHTGQSTVLGDRSSGILDPGAVKLADLNGDGIPDLIVANSGSNNVLIYPGLGNGQFGEALNGGHGFFTGTNPVGITVADVNGDGRPDLVVANKGSNDISILFNESQGKSFTFFPGPRLKAGSGPSGTAVADVNGDGKPDIVVSNSESNTMMVLPGVGGGFFNDQNPTTIPVGTQPGSPITGNFDGRPGVVTINSGSNDLTLISSLNMPAPIIQTIPSGGTDPVTGFAFDAGHGFDDLVVGNAGNGGVALFEGGPHGLVLSSHRSADELIPNLSELSFTVLSGGQVYFYAASEGREAAILVTLNLGGAAGIQGTLSPGHEVTQLVPLQESSLALIGTLLTSATEPSGNEINFGAAEAALSAGSAVSLGAVVPVPQSLSHEGGVGAGGREAEFIDVTAGSAQPASPSRERLILGLDEALEQFGREKPDRFSSGFAASPVNDERGNGHEPGPRDPGGSVRPVVPGRLYDSQGRHGDPGPSQPNRIEAADVILHSPLIEDHHHQARRKRIEGTIDRTPASLVAFWALARSAGPMLRMPIGPTRPLHRPIRETSGERQS
jgi:hypothetical protein